MTITFKAGDCLENIKELETNSIDLCYFNPPFGITDAEYDKPLNWSELWLEIWRVLKPKGMAVIHSSQPFTFDLVASQRKHFKYCWYWKKLACAPTGYQFSKYQPGRIMEEICVFYKKSGTYNPQMVLRDKPYTDKGNRIMKTKYYGGINDTIKQPIINKTHNHPIHIIEMKRRKHKFSTRLVVMCEYFIKTYTNENNTVLDLTCSDGQTALACNNLNRKYIGFDLNPEMIELSKKRLEEHIKDKTLKKDIEEI